MDLFITNQEGCLVFGSFNIAEEFLTFSAYGIVLEEYINLLKEAEKKGDVKVLKEILRKVVSGFTPENEIIDVLSLQKKS